MLQRSFIYNERKINCYFKGDVTKRTIVFIHGNSLSAQTFEEQFNTIENIPLVAIDLPGHGLSEPALHPEETYSVLGYVAAAKYVISELKLTDYILVGHSLGGHIAIEASDELKGIKGVVFFGTPPVGIPLQLDKAFLPNPAVSLLFQEVLTETETESLAELAGQNGKEKLKKLIRLSHNLVRPSIAASIANGVFKDEIEILKKSTFPVAIFHGENDTVINREYIDALEIPALWKKKIQLIDGAGHCPQMEQAVKFDSLLVEFYNSINSSA